MNNMPVTKVKRLLQCVAIGAMFVGAAAGAQAAERSLNLEQQLNPNAPGVLEDLFYVVAPNEEHIREWIYDATFSGPVVTLPSGKVRVAVGAEYRDTDVDFPLMDPDDPDNRWYARARDTNSSAFFAEGQIPVIGERWSRSGARELSFSIAARHDEYTAFNGKTVMSYGMVYRPMERLKLRGTWSEGFKVPTLLQRYEPMRVGIEYYDPVYYVVPDPQRGGQPLNGEIPTTRGGNPGLRPERSENLSAGVELEMPGIDGLKLTVDYFRSEYLDRITQVDPLTQLLSFPETITRGDRLPNDPVGWEGPVIGMDARNLNTAINTSPTTACWTAACGGTRSPSYGISDQSGVAPRTPIHHTRGFMKTGFNLIQTAVMTAAVLALAPAFTVAQTATASQAAGAATGKAGKPGMGYQPPEYLIGRSDVIADLGIKVEKGMAPKAVLATLTPAQRKRLDQIAIQIQGYNALRLPEVQQALELSSGQAEKLEQLAADNMASVEKIFESDLDDEEKRARFVANRDKNASDMLAVLTAAQRAEWEAMQGPKFTLDKNLGIAVFASPNAEVSQQPSEPAKPLLADGTQAPDFEAYTADGKKVKLSDYRGKVVVLDFWATWCGPCMAGMPSLEATARGTQGQDVVFLALNVWDKESAFKKWVGVNSALTMNFARDPAGESRQAKGIADSYNVSGIPTTYVIDREGRIAGVPKGAAMASSGPSSKPIRTNGKPEKEMVELLGKLGIQVKSSG